MDCRSPALDIAAYLRRVGYDGPLEPGLETLSGLHFSHALAIPFENLDPLTGRPVRLDIAALQQKLLHENRGGYCFEQNLLFMEVLRALGFTVSGLAARVLWNLPEDAVTPTSHMLLRIDMGDGIRIADVGFGGLTLTAPLRLEAGLEQKTPHETFRLDREGDDWRMRAQVGGAWRTVYRFGMEERFQVDYEVSNYFTSTNPESHFLHSLIAARPNREGRLALLNRRLSIYPGDGRAAESRGLASLGEIETVLGEAFGIRIPDRTALDQALRREAII